MRIERRNFYSIYCAAIQNPVSIYDFNPLPFDDELIELEQQQQKEDITEWYKRASEELPNFNWPARPSKN